MFSPATHLTKPEGAGQWVDGKATAGASPHFSPGGEMIAQRFGFTRHLLKEWNNSVYFQLKKRSCGFKDQGRARQSGEKWGLICFDLSSL